MKTKFMKDYKRYLTIEEYEQGKRVQEEYGGYEETAETIARGIADRADIYADKVLSVELFIAKNCNIPEYNYWGSDTGFMDVFAEIVVKNYDGYYELSMNLSEYYSTEALPYVRAYTKK